MADNKINKTRHCADRLCAASRWKCKNEFISKMSFFITNHELFSKSFRSRFDPKHSYKTVNKRLQSQSTPRTAIRIVMRHILNKIKDCWRPTNIHDNQYNTQVPIISTTRPRPLIAFQPTYTTFPPANKPASQEQLLTTHLLTFIWWKKRTCIFSNPPTSI